MISDRQESCRRLCDVAAGEKVRLKSLQGGRGFHAHLAGLGLTPGIELRAVTGGSTGPMVLEVRGGRIVLGRGMTEQIEVE